MSGEPRGSTGLTLSIPPELVEVIAERAAAIVIDQLASRGPEPWIAVEDAATHLACSRKRIYDLVSQRRVRVFRDGRRLLFRRSWLDEALEEGPPPAEEVGSLLACPDGMLAGPRRVPTAFPPPPRSRV